MNRTIFLIILMIVLFSPMAAAVGLTGGALRRHEYFKPNSEYQFYYEIVGSKTLTNSYNAYAKRNLSEYVVFDGPTRFEDIPPGKHIPFSGKLVFPEYIRPPGKYDVYICGIEDCPSNKGNCGRTSACAVLEFTVLHSGIFPVITFNIPNVNKDETAIVNGVIKNLGEKEIKSATGEVTIFNLAGDTVGRVEFGDVSIGSTLTGYLQGSFETKGLPPSNYSGQARFRIDGQEHQANTTFRIGDIEVRLINYTTELMAGTIQPFKVTAESGWGDPLDAFATVTLSKGGKFIAKGKTPTEIMEPWGMTTFSMFMDTTDVAPGDYEMAIRIDYDNFHMIEETYITLYEPVEPMEEKGPTEQEPKESGLDTATLTIILVVIVALLTVMNVFLALYRKKK